MLHRHKRDGCTFIRRRVACGSQNWFHEQDRRNEDRYRAYLWCILDNEMLCTDNWLKRATQLGSCVDKVNSKWHKDKEMSCEASADCHDRPVHLWSSTSLWFFLSLGSDNYCLKDWFGSKETEATSEPKTAPPRLSWSTNSLWSSTSLRFFLSLGSDNFLTDWFGSKATEATSFQSSDLRWFDGADSSSC
jgi:hypothetical protein